MFVHSTTYGVCSFVQVKLKIKIDDKGLLAACFCETRSYCH